MVRREDERMAAEIADRKFIITDKRHMQQHMPFSFAYNPNRSA